MKLAFVCVLLVLGMIRGEEDTGDTEPEQEQLDVDPYCMELPPTLDGPCSERGIWTFDYSKGRCVQITGCFEEAGPEYNMFSSEMGCQRWCKA